MGGLVMVVNAITIGMEEKWLGMIFLGDWKPPISDNDNNYLVDEGEIL